MKARKVDLTTICGGGLHELFQRELTDVMQNIADPNTDPKKPRRITMTLDVYPRPDRQNCEIELGVTSKVLPVAKMAGSLFIASASGKLEAYTTDLRQQDFLDEAEEDESAEPATRTVPYVLKKEAN